MSDVVVSVRDVRLRRAARVILAGMSFAVTRGEIVALMGQSGSGKTTILRSIAALETFESGTIDVDDVSLPPGTPPASLIRRLRRKVGMVFQFHCLFDHLTALTNVTLAPTLAHGVTPARRRTARPRAAPYARRRAPRRRAAQGAVGR